MPIQEQKSMPKGSEFQNKMKNMQAMFIQKGGFGAPRPSAQIMGMPHGFSNLMGNNINNKGNGISVEKHEDLEKKLDKIVVQKNKKKKKKISFQDDNE